MERVNAQHVLHEALLMFGEDRRKTGKGVGD